MCVSVNTKLVMISTTEIESLEARQKHKKHTKQKLNRNDENEKIFIADLLALSTYHTRKMFAGISEVSRYIEKSNFYKILTRTTQPAHVLSIFIVLIISHCLWPALQGHFTAKRSNLVNFIYLASFATHFGAQIWMTFVSGLALYFSLPRHIFGRCQEILFPKYFLLNTILSCLTLITFAKFGSTSSHTNFQWLVQFFSLSMCVMIEMVIYLYLTPVLLHNMKLKYQYEGKMGNGQEIGHQEKFKGINFPQYQLINKNFRKVHMKCAVGNIMTICCSFFHMYYLASKIHIQML